MKPRPPLELWGGVECTIVRIGDAYRNQVAETGHSSRVSDLDLIAGLGIRTLRYPVLWEMVAPESLDRPDWRWTDERLGRLRTLEITPVAGLVHHGSGPRYTHLLDPAFPELLGRYAGMVAARYPWLEWFVPINEPLTTARFSMLYGHWYPHARDERSFLRALVNQCRGAVLAMQEIRRFTPTAKFVQTEDLGRVFSTAHLAYQAHCENTRRWLSYDLLCGRVGRDHEWRKVFLANGIGPDELAFFEDASCAPDILGANHYVTSDRYLDERVGLYPGIVPGGNGRDRYVDVEAVRVAAAEGRTGPLLRLRELWERYGKTIAVTEAHLACSEDEQVRWLLEVWDAAARLARSGADIRAVTIWSLLGAVDWSSLLTRTAGDYEAGAFDMGSMPPRRTQLGETARALSGGTESGATATPGWWRRPERIHPHQLATASLAVAGIRDHGG